MQIANTHNRTNLHKLLQSWFIVKLKHSIHFTVASFHRGRLFVSETALAIVFPFQQTNKPIDNSSPWWYSISTEEARSLVSRWRERKRKKKARKETSNVWSRWKPQKRANTRPRRERTAEEASTSQTVTWKKYPNDGKAISLRWRNCQPNENRCLFASLSSQSILRSNQSRVWTFQSL